MEPLASTSRDGSIITRADSFELDDFVDNLVTGILVTSRANMTELFLSIDRWKEEALAQSGDSIEQTVAFEEAVEKAERHLEKFCTMRKIFGPNLDTLSLHSKNSSSPSVQNFTWSDVSMDSPKNPPPEDVVSGRYSSFGCIERSPVEFSSSSQKEETQDSPPVKTVPLDKRYSTFSCIERSPVKTSSSSLDVVDKQEVKPDSTKSDASLASAIKVTPTGDAIRDTGSFYSTFSCIEKCKNKDLDVSPTERFSVDSQYSTSSCTEKSPKKDISASSWKTLSMDSRSSAFSTIDKTQKQASTPVRTRQSEMAVSTINVVKQPAVEKLAPCPSPDPANTHEQSPSTSLLKKSSKCKPQKGKAGKVGEKSMKTCSPNNMEDIQVNTETTHVAKTSLSSRAISDVDQETVSLDSRYSTFSCIEKSEKISPRSSPRVAAETIGLAAPKTKQDQFKTTGEESDRLDSPFSSSEKIKTKPCQSEQEEARSTQETVSVDSRYSTFSYIEKSQMKSFSVSNGDQQDEMSDIIDIKSEISKDNEKISLDGCYSSFSRIEKSDEIFPVVDDDTLHYQNIGTTLYASPKTPSLESSVSSDDTVDLLLKLDTTTLQPPVDLEIPSLASASSDDTIDLFLKLDTAIYETAINLTALSIDSHDSTVSCLGRSKSMFSSGSSEDENEFEMKPDFTEKGQGLEDNLQRTVSIDSKYSRFNCIENSESPGIEKATSPAVSTEAISLGSRNSIFRCIEKSKKKSSSSSLGKMDKQEMVQHSAKIGESPNPEAVSIDSRYSLYSCIEENQPMSYSASSDDKEKEFKIQPSFTDSDLQLLIEEDTVAQRAATDKLEKVLLDSQYSLLSYIEKSAKSPDIDKNQQDNTFDENIGTALAAFLRPESVVSNASSDDTIDLLLNLDTVTLRTNESQGGIFLNKILNKEDICKHCMSIINMFYGYIIQYVFDTIETENWFDTPETEWLKDTFTLENYNEFMKKRQQNEEETTAYKIEFPDEDSVTLRSTSSLFENTETKYKSNDLQANFKAKKTKKSTVSAGKIMDKIRTFLNEAICALCENNQTKSASTKESSPHTEDEDLMEWQKCPRCQKWVYQTDTGSLLTCASKYSTFSCIQKGGSCRSSKGHLQTRPGIIKKGYPDFDTIENEDESDIEDSDSSITDVPSSASTGHCSADVSNTDTTDLSDFSVFMVSLLRRFSKPTVKEAQTTPLRFWRRLMDKFSCACDRGVSPTSAK